MYETILYEIEGAAATITLNRPEKLNAIDGRMQHEIRHALASAEADANVVGIVITGAGRGFSAGADMNSLQVIQAAGAVAAAEVQSRFGRVELGDRSIDEDFGPVFTYFLTVRKPIIAAINGPCAGLGFSLACYCDLRFMADSAILVTSYAPRGLVAEHGTSWILPHLIGPARALDVLWSSRRIDGNEALQLGLANRVLPKEELLAATQAYVNTLAASSAPYSLQKMKWQIYRAMVQPFGAAMQEAHRLMDESVQRGEFKEGIVSFLERRPPSFPRLGGHPV